jgi:hypothetical protein
VDGVARKAERRGRRMAGRMNGGSKPANVRRWAYWLLLIPFIATLVPSFYASARPQLFGFPFFYWYQFFWIAGAGIVTGVVYLLTR